MFRRLSMALAASILMVGAAYADPIEGNWKTDKRLDRRDRILRRQLLHQAEDRRVCRQEIGKFKADGGNNYSGTITDPANDKTYTGKATLSGPTEDERLRAWRPDLRSQNWKKL